MHPSKRPNHNHMCLAGGDQGTTTDDAEIHSKNSLLRVIDSEKAGTNSVLKQQADAVQKQVFIVLKPNHISVNGGNGLNYTDTNRSFKMDTMYLGLNRVIRNYQGSASSTGSGLCNVCIEIS